MAPRIFIGSSQNPNSANAATTLAQASGKSRQSPGLLADDHMPRCSRRARTCRTASIMPGTNALSSGRLRVTTGAGSLPSWRVRRLTCLATLVRALARAMASAKSSPADS